MYCSKCGANNRTGARFCSICGQSLGDAAEPSVGLGGPGGAIQPGGGGVTGRNIRAGRDIAGHDIHNVQRHTGLDGDELARLFAAIYQSVEARREEPDVDKAEIAGTVRQVQEEVVKGEEANPQKIARWLKTLADIAPDILQVTAAALTHPAAGIAAVIRAVAARVEREASQR